MPLVRFLAAHGELLLIGVTALLAAGAVAMRLQRSPIHRQRLGELTVGCTLLWAVLACLPMARPLARPLAPVAPPPVVPPVHPTLPAPTRVVPARPVPGPVTKPVSPIYFAELRPQEIPATAPVYDSPAVLARAGPAATPAPVGEDAAAEVAQPGVGGRTLIAGIFVAGATLCGGWLGLGGLVLRRMVRRASGPPGWLVDLFESLEGSGRRAPRLLVSPDCRRPVSCGVFRPTVVLPADAVAPENRAQLCQVLLHELGHVRQRDAWGNLLFNFALPVLYFHPLYWLARRDVHLCRELVADDWAAARFGKESYVAELVALARTALGHDRDVTSPWGSMGLFRSPTHFYRRMHMLIQRTDRLATSCSYWWRFTTAAAFGCALAVAAGVAGLQPARAQDADAVETTVAPGASNGTEAERSAHERDKAKLDKHVDELARRLAETQSALEDTMKRLQAAQNESASAKQQQAQREVQIREHLDHLLAVQKEYQDLQAQAKREAPRRNGPTAEDAVFDKFIADRLDEMKTHPDGVSDEAFVRRLYLDLMGTPPDPKVLDAFRSDTSPDKRDRLLRELVQYARQRGAEAGAQAGADRQNLAVDTRPGAANAGAQVAGDPFARGIAAAGRGGGQIDLVTLAVNYIDAIGDVRTTEAQLQRTAQLVQQANASSLELDLQKSAYQTAQRKVQLLRGLIEIALAAARADYESAADMAKKGFAPQSQLAEAKQRLQILELILKSGQ